MSYYSPNTLKARMNFTEEKYDKIFLLEDENIFENLNLNKSDIPSSINDIFSFLKLILVQYGKKEKKCKIKDLKIYFDFIKVIYSKENENNENNVNNSEYNENNVNNSEYNEKTKIIQMIKSSKKLTKT